MTKLCRGCAGTGIGQHVSPRTIAVLEHISYTWRFVHDNPRRKRRTITVGNPGSPSSPRFYGTVPIRAFALAVREADRLLADGFSYDEESAAIPIDPEWTCPWCHGTGTPQLSVGTLGAMGAAMTRLQSDLNDLITRRENHEAAQRARAEGRYP